MFGGLQTQVRFLAAIPYVLVLLFVGLPLQIATRPMWDGVIAAYAADTGNIEGLTYIADAGGLKLAVGFAESLIIIGDITGLGFHLVNDLVSIASLLLLVHEVRLFAKNILGFTVNWSILSASLVAVFPIWHVLLTSAVTYYIFALALGLLAVRFIQQPNKAFQVFGLVAALLSFGFSSMLVVIPMLSFVSDVLKKDDHREIALRWPSLPTWVLFSSSMLFFLVQRTFNAPTGAFSGYNSLLSPFILNSYYEVALGLVNFFSYLVFPAAGITVAISLLNLSKPRTLFLVHSDFDAVRNRAIVVLLVASILPYLAVGKSSSIIPFDWSQRHAFVLAPAISFFTVVLLLSLFGPKLKPDLTVRRVAALSIGVVLMLQIGALTVGFISKMNHQTFENNLEQVLTSLNPRPPEGVLQVVVEGMPWKTQFSDYDANYLLYTATGSAGYYTRIAPVFDPNFGVPDWLTSGSTPTSIYVYEDKGSACTTKIFVSAFGYSGVQSAISNVFGIGGSPTMNVTNYSSHCQ